MTALPTSRDCLKGVRIFYSISGLPRYSTWQAAAKLNIEPTASEAGTSCLNYYNTLFSESQQLFTWFNILYTIIRQEGIWAIPQELARNLLAYFTSYRKKILDIRQYACIIFARSAEKSDFASFTQVL